MLFPLVIVTLPFIMADPSPAFKGAHQRAGGTATLTRLRIGFLIPAGPDASVTKSLTSGFRSLTICGPAPSNISVLPANWTSK